jgi:hypothetical protein
MRSMVEEAATSAESGIRPRVRNRIHFIFVIPDGA